MKEKDSPPEIIFHFSLQLEPSCCRFTHRFGSVVWEEGVSAGAQHIVAVEGVAKLSLVSEAFVFLPVASRL